ncbi:MAG: hypothetical protein KDH96_12805 [Candidatus Riesia sp.]|nr:hypothetical protein [Candidatus Riesia sp.]
MRCSLCNIDKDTNSHHLIPVTLHKRKWFIKNFDKNYMKSNRIDVCYLCHKSIHRLYDEKTLGKYFNTLDKLLSSDKIKNHIKWVRKQK